MNARPSSRARGADSLPCPCEPHFHLQVAEHLNASRPAARSEAAEPVRLSRFIGFSQGEPKGTLPEATVTRIRTAPMADLDRWVERVITAATLEAVLAD